MLGYNRQTLNPYLVIGLYDNELGVDVLPGGTVSTSVQVPFSEEEAVSINAIITPLEEGQIQRVGAQFDLGEEGLLSLSYGAGDVQSGSLNYRRQIGPVASSLSVRGSENMQEVMVNFDFSRVFEFE